MVAAAVAAGDGLTELFGLKMSASVFFSGEGDGLTAGEAEVVVFILRVVFEAGSSGGCVVAAGETVAAGEASVVAAAFAPFLRDFFAGEGDASGVVGEALAAGEASVAAAAFFFECLAGEPEAVGVGDWALTRQAPARPITTKKTKDFVCMSQSLTKRR